MMKRPKLRRSFYHRTPCKHFLIFLLEFCFFYNKKLLDYDIFQRPRWRPSSFQSKEEARFFERKEEKSWVSIFFFSTPVFFVKAILFLKKNWKNYNFRFQYIYCSTLNLVKLARIIILYFQMGFQFSII